MIRQKLINLILYTLTSPIWLNAAASNNPKFPPNDIGICTAYNTCTVVAPGKVNSSKTPVVITVMPTKGMMRSGFRRPLQSLQGPTNNSTTVEMREPTKLRLMFTPDTIF